MITTLTRRLHLAALACFLCASAACGDGESAGDAHDAALDAGGVDAAGLDCAFTACGGDVVGTWTMNDSCATQDFATVECPSRSGAIDYAASGTLTFAADMTVSGTLTLAGTTTQHLPTSCLPPGTACADLADPSVQQACDEAGDGCDCVHTFGDPPFEVTGTWATSGSVLTLGELGDLDYCVSGSTLWLRKVDADGPIGLQLTRP